jgi:hypothetical protein
VSGGLYLLKPPEFIDTGRPFVPATVSYEPAESGSVRNKAASHPNGIEYVANRGGGANKSSTDGW